MASKGIIGAIYHGTRFGSKLGVYALQMSIARRKAIKAFARELKGMGLPDDIVKDLSDAYPNLQLGELKNLADKVKSSSH